MDGEDSWIFFTMSAETCLNLVKTWSAVAETRSRRKTLRAVANYFPPCSRR
jgi:hypothetical protein